MTRLIFLRYTATMNRMIMLFSVVLIVFATSGIHKIAAAGSIEQTSMQSLSRTVAPELVQNATDADCCVEQAAADWQWRRRAREPTAARTIE